MYPESPFQYYLYHTVWFVEDDVKLIDGSDVYEAMQFILSKNFGNVHPKKFSA